MLNFPVVIGTSGHIVGGTLIAIFLGPYATIISQTIILVIQAFLFSDGGITALGANVFNMGVVSALSYYVYTAIRMGVHGKEGLITATSIASWASTVLGAVACGFELGVSSTFQPYGGVAMTVPIMALWHALIGLGEAFITSSIVTYTVKVRPDLLELEKLAPHVR